MLLAQRALRDPDARVGTIAAELGYRSDAAFSNAFKREVGESPLHYRRRLQHTACPLPLEDLDLVRPGGTEHSRPRRPGRGTEEQRERARIADMGHDLQVDDVPADFDDSADPEGQVHAIARRVFSGPTNVAVFAKVQQWLGRYEVLLIDVSCDYMFGEPDPVSVSIYFRFKGADER